jgi:PTS system nitrogen regulatory IIA component
VAGDGRQSSDSDIMTLTEIAGYLKVSEKTVVRMVQAGKLPGAKVSSQWRFMRAAIDDWLNARMYSLPKKELMHVVATANNVIPVTELVTPSRIVMDLKPGSKAEVLRQLAQPLYETKVIADLDRYTSLLIEREELLSTAVGHGLAIPHIRDPEESNAASTCMVLGICSEGMDFDSLDGRKTFVFALPCTSSEASHLRLVATISLIFRGAGVLGRMKTAASKDAIIEVLAETDVDVSSSL